MKTIKDPVHGYIFLEDNDLKLIKNKYIQRLRNITQLSTTQMVYPSARHSRFEHTIGVYHLCTSIFNGIKQSSEEFINDSPSEEEIKKIENTLKCASLLHDVGHYPFSHLGEQFVSKDKLLDKLDRLGFISEFEKLNLLTDKPGVPEDTPKKECIKMNLRGKAAAHELTSCCLVLDKLKDTIISIYDVNPFEVAAFILGYSFEDIRNNKWRYCVAAHILNSRIDADRLDYLLRDDKMSGASLVNLDCDRMVMAYTVCNKDLALSTKALSLINNLILARESIYLWVNQHHKVVFSNALVKKMIEILPDSVKSDLFEYESIAEKFADDHSVFCQIRKHIEKNGEDANLLAKYYDMFSNRNFLKSLWKNIIDFYEKIDDESVQDYLTQDIMGNPKKMEKYLIKHFDLDDYQVIIDTSQIKTLNIRELRDIHIEYEGRVINAAKHDLYKPRDRFVKPVPYVFVDKDIAKNAVTFLKSYSRRDRMQAEKNYLGVQNMKNPTIKP